MRAQRTLVHALEPIEMAGVVAAIELEPKLVPYKVRVTLPAVEGKIEENEVMAGAAKEKLAELVDCRPERATTLAVNLVPTEAGTEQVI